MWGEGGEGGGLLCSGWRRRIGLLARVWVEVWLVRI